MKNELLLIVDLGAHNNQQVAKIVRSLKVYCEVVAYDDSNAESLSPKGVIVIGDEEPGAPEYNCSFSSPVMSYGNTKDAQEISDFLFNTCGFSGDWSVDAFIESAINEIKEAVGDKKVICALSGGVDSAVCAVLVHKAIGDKLTCIFVNHGLMRKGEPELVNKLFGEQFNIPLICVDAQDRFLSRLAGVSEPETKRKIIGEEFIRVFEEEANALGNTDFLVQGTIYPDIIESISKKGVVKSHHNVGGLPERFNFELIEPIKWLFKDEVREVGLALGMPEGQIWRQPFPGPGLGVRVVGEITKEKLEIVREADAIFREEIADAGLSRKIWQYFALVPGCKSTGVVDGERRYGEVVCLRAILSNDAMSADIAQLPYELLTKCANRIVRSVDGVSRVVYDITPKPPATIEWE